MSVVVENVTFGDAIYRIGRNTGDWTAKDEQNEKAAATAKKDAGELLAILDKSLAGRHFLTGNDYTLADAHVASLLGWPRMMKWIEGSSRSRHIELSVDGKSASKHARHLRCGSRR